MRQVLPWQPGHQPGLMGPSELQRSGGVLYTRSSRLSPALNTPSWGTAFLILTP